MIRRESLRTNLTFLGCVAVCLAADLGSKSYVKAHYGHTMFEPRGRDVIPGCLSIWYKENAGGVFGALQGKAHWFIVFTVVALGFLAWLLVTTDRSQKRLNIGIALITAGAVGNLHDRLLNAGKVRDFLDCYIGRYHWYTFNIADAAICVGVGLLMLDVLINRPEPKDSAEKSPAKRT